MEQSVEERREQARVYYEAFRGVLRAAEGLCTGVRSREYGPPSGNFIHGDESYLEMVWVKVSRLVNLVNVKREALAKDGWDGWEEFDRGRLADSLIDLINYSGFWAADILLAGAWPERLDVQPTPMGDDAVVVGADCWP